MIDYSLIKLIPADESHREFSDAIKEAAYRGYIEKMWGWEEEAAREYNERTWRDKRPQIILYNDQPIGTIYVGEDEESIEIAQFILISEYQNQGIGTHILEGILDSSDKTGTIVKLEVLKENPAISLYRRYGFTISASDEYLYQMERNPDGSK